MVWLLVFNMLVFDPDILLHCMGLVYDCCMEQACGNRKGRTNLVLLLVRFIIGFGLTEAEIIWTYVSGYDEISLNLRTMCVFCFIFFGTFGTICFAIIISEIIRNMLDEACKKNVQIACISFLRVFEMVTAVLCISITALFLGHIIESWQFTFVIVVGAVDLLLDLFYITKYIFRCCHKTYGCC